MINLCHHSVKPLISSDKLSFDGYEVTNLISSNSESKRKGYLSDHFMKPPFNITVQFPCNIEIYRIIINPVIGQQKSCDIRIFTATRNINNSWLFGNTKTILDTSGLLFNAVGNVSQIEPTTVCFENQFFKNRGNAQKDVTCFPCMAYLNARKSGGLTNVSHVTICIQKTKDSKAGAIRSLEIWGIASSKVPYKIQQLLWNTYSDGLAEDERKYQMLFVTKDAKSKENKTCHTTNEVQDKLENNTNLYQLDGIEIPEDFIDPITFEIMALPVLLPSGKCIDQTTLDKFVNTEASWGRSPSDPFTGCAFVGGSKPETNMALKARIDQFVLSHSETLKSIPRTLGGEKNNSRTGKSYPLKTSRLISPDEHATSSLNVQANDYSSAAIHKLSVVNTSGPKSLISSSGTSTTSVDLQNSEPIFMLPAAKSSITTGIEPKYNSNSNRTAATKRKCDNLASPNQFAKIQKTSCLSISGNVFNGVGQSVDPGSAKSLECTGAHAIKKHKTDLAQSLDSALFSALSGLPTFSKHNSKLNSAATVDKNDNDDICLCFKCGSNLAEEDLIKYKLPCEHLVCRQCLQALKGDIVCLTCKMSCKSNQVVRLF